MFGRLALSIALWSVAFLLLVTAKAFAADPSPEALIKAGHWKRARRLIEQRYQSSPNEAQAEYLLSQIKEAFGDPEGALPLAEKAVAASAGNSSYHLLLGQICGEMAERASFFKAGGWAKRLKAEAEKAADLDPKNLDARFTLIEYYLQAPRLMGGSKDRARAMAAAIGQVNPGQGYVAQARLAQEEKDSAQQENFLKKAVAASPGDYDVQIALANFYNSDSKKEFDLARRPAREALRIDAERTEAYSALAATYARSQRRADLDAILEQAERKVPDDLSPYYQAGRALLAEGQDLPRAERYFRKYLTQEPEGSAPTLAHAHWRLGLVLEKEGRESEAVSELETALRLRPDLNEARKDLRRMKG